MYCSFPRVLVITLIGYVLTVKAGEYVPQDFTLRAFSRNVFLTSDSLSIAPRETTTIAIVKDTILRSSSADSSYCPIVVASMTGDTFTFVWNIGTASIHHTYTRDIILTQNGFQMENQTPVVLNSPSTIRHLHVAQGTSLSNTITTYYYAPNVCARFNNYNVQFPSMRYHSVCHLGANIFVIVYTEGNSQLEIRKVQVVGSLISFTSDSVPGIVSQNSSGPPGYFSNTSTAADSSGNILIMITRGAQDQTKYVEYVLTNSTYDSNGTGRVANAISLNTSGAIDYADAPIVSYADKKFASLFWDSFGIYLFTLECDGNPSRVSDTTITLIQAGNTFRAPTIATNGSTLFLAWKNLSSGKIEGKTVGINNGVLSAVPMITQIFSDGSTIVDDAGPELNSAVDGKGNFAVTWKQGSDAVAAILANKGIVYPTAQWISNVQSITVLPGDSLQFLPSSLDTSLNKGSISVSVQVGPSTDTTDAGWQNWADIGSASALSQHTLGTLPYYRLKVDFSRSSVDSFRTPVLNSLSLVWNSKPKLTSLDSIRINGQTLQRGTGFGDTIDIVSHTDSVDCYVTASDGDTEDPIILSVPWEIHPHSAKDTMAENTVNRLGYIRLHPRSIWDTVYSCVFSLQDNHFWNSEPKILTIRARKEKPVITSVTFNGALCSDKSIQKVTIGTTTTIAVTTERSKTTVWNPLTYRFRTNLFDTSFSTASQCSFIPREHDDSLIIIVSDGFTASDTISFLLKYSKYTNDSLTNPLYFHAKKTLSDSLTSIIGSNNTTKVIVFPIKNTGNDTLLIDSVYFKKSQGSWFQLGIPYDTGVAYFSFLSASSNILPLKIPMDSTIPLTFKIDVSKFTGDGLLHDTVFIFTNDPILSIDTVPITAEYNDLPVLSGLRIDFTGGKPYWLEKADRKTGYTFPPHGDIHIHFSESIDSVSAFGKIYAYSIFDSTQSGKIDTIRMEQQWSDVYKTLILKPDYSQASTYFNGLKPPRTMFIPTDSIALYLSSDIRDLATTPSSPNYLDVNKDYIRDFATDTVIRLRVDSIHFTLETVSPAPGTINSFDTPIMITFSSPIFPHTIDYSLKNNTSLLLTSKFNSLFDSTKQIDFDSIFIDSNTIVFLPAKKFFIGDSVYCHYRGIAARDSLGYSIDMNNDGIPMGFFDSLSQDDDYTWSFLIDDILTQTFEPDSADTNVSIRTPLSIGFSSPIFPGTIDTALKGNRTLTVTSRFSKGIPITFDRVVVTDTKATFFLEHRLFYHDSVFCTYHGFITKDTAFFSVDMGLDTIVSSNKNQSWFFTVTPLSIVSVNPDSGAINAGVRQPIIMDFTGPISPLIFDTTRDADSNKSFYFTTSYSSGHPMPISNITFSHDSSRVSVFTQKAFFSYDSIFCEFRGFRSGYQYGEIVNLIPVDSLDVLGNKQWFFKTADEGFYIYPNPFKPGSNRRHRSLGGIWLKNLHTLAARGTLTEVKIKVFSINTHPVFESPFIQFKEKDPDQKPEWFWNTRNNRGSPLASGVYLYAIYDRNSKVLVKGKVLIVR